jgi:SAM-dependent methyltransferase
MSGFADHFSMQAGSYAQYRPLYPASLFSWLAERAPSRERAWDCGTGSGQAAVALSRHFDTVIATDPSASQIGHAKPTDGVRYAVMTAERSAIATASVSLVTVAQALHWFDLSAFYREVQRVLVPGGVLAVWSYGLLTIEPAIDELIAHFYTDTVGPYWPAERAIVDAGYGTLDFPFAEEEAPAVAMEAEWTAGQLLGFLSTWSAVARFRSARGEDPMPRFAEALSERWGDRSLAKRVCWPLSLRMGRLV